MRCLFSESQIFAESATTRLGAQLTFVLVGVPS